MYDAAIAISVMLSFVTEEAFGLLSGGMVSAGYLALFVEQPLRVAFTLLLAVAVCVITRLFSKHVLLFGRRRFMCAFLLSLILAWLFERLMMKMAILPQDFRIVGHVVPGLIANDMYRQGIVKTLLTELLSSVLIRLLLMAMTGL